MSKPHAGAPHALIQVNSLALNHGIHKQTNDDDAPARTGADDLSQCEQGAIDGNSG